MQKKQSVKLFGYFRKKPPTELGWGKQRRAEIFFYFKKMFFYFKKNNSILFITSPNIVRLSFHLIPPLKKSKDFLLWIFKCASFTEFHIKLLRTSLQTDFLSKGSIWKPASEHHRLETVFANTEQTKFISLKALF